MKISLRKANAVQHAIIDKVRSISLGSTISLGEFDDISTLEASVKTLAENRLFVDNLWDIYYTIRADVDDVNHKIGVNVKLNKLARLEKSISMISDMVASGVMDDKEKITLRVAKLSDSDTVNRYHGPTSVVTSLFTREDINLLEKDLGDLKRQRAQLNDELLELNITNHVQIPEHMQEILTVANIL